MTTFVTYPNVGVQDNIVDIFNEIALNLRVNYLCGPIDDIVATLQNQTAGGAKKYPLIALIMPFTPVQGGTWDTSFNDLNFLIATLVENPAVKFIDRYNASFKGILYPLYERFIATIADSCYFREYLPEKIAYDPIDTSNGQRGNVLPDYIDFMWIKNMKLNLIGKETK